MSGQPIALTSYPVDAALLAAALLRGRESAQPAIVAQEALRCWNRFLAEGDEQQRATFLEHVDWLLAHAAPCAGEGEGWPVLTSIPTLPEPAPLLSASTQGLALSALARAYHLTSQERYRDMAQRAARPFARDIFDGGVCAPVGSAGVFFQEVAAYPASHDLSACLIALLGLYDYLALIDDAELAEQITRCRSTLATILPAFNTGYWSRADLASRRLALPARHALHSVLLKALAQASGDAAWSALAEHWASYQRSFASRLRYQLSSAASRWRQGCIGWVRRRFQRTATIGQPGKKLVCVPITAFPIPGGMRSVLAGIAQAMVNDWEMEYLTWHVGPNHEGLTIWSFGNAKTANWQFPNVWFYVFAGWRRLVSLLRQGRGYHLILAQDGVFTGAYAAIAARLAGVRIVSMDHGNITLPSSQTFRTERLKALEAAPWRSRLLSRLRFACYWPSLHLLARIATRTTDCFLAAGDAVEAAYRQQFGVSADRISQFPFLIDTERYAPCDALKKAQRRAQLHLPADGLIVVMVNRLAPAKGIDIALQGISKALSQLPADLGARIRVVIAGDGPLRAQVEEDIRALHLESTCLLWGEITRDDVAKLLSVSDFFLFTATRDITSVAVLEAMSAGLMVIASTTSPAKAALLADGRGLAIPVGDAEAVGAALAEMLCDLPRAKQMGMAARAYIITHHRAEVLRRCLLRATGWPLAIKDVHQGLRASDLNVVEQQIS